MKREKMPASAMTTLRLDVLTCFGCDQVFRIGRSALNAILKVQGTLRCCQCLKPLWITRYPRGSELN